MNVEKLTILAEFLDQEVVDCNFDLGFFQYIPRSKLVEGDTQDKLLTKKDDFHCGYVACAMGWCPTIFGDFVESCSIVTGDFHWDELKMAEYFGLSREQFCYLFSPYNNNMKYEIKDYDESRPGTVKRIRDFIKHDGMPPQLKEFLEF